MGRLLTKAPPLSLRSRHRLPSCDGNRANNLRVAGRVQRPGVLQQGHHPIVRGLGCHGEVQHAGCQAGTLQHGSPLVVKVRVRIPAAAESVRR